MDQPSIHNKGPVQNQNIAQQQWITQHFYDGRSEAVSTVNIERQDRTYLLKKVRTTWIEGFLEKSLHQAVWIDLDLQEQPDMLKNPWLLVMQEFNQPPRTLPPGTNIVQIYDEADGELLIIGEPGAGKTTLLLDLARALLNRAEHNEHYPIPVVFPLSSWANERQPLAKWLVEELHVKYKVPRLIGKAWLESKQLILLLDGLDEVAADARSACVVAINTYHQLYINLPLVLCSRKSEYIGQEERIQLEKAVIIQPLTEQHIETFFQTVGEKLSRVHILLQQDITLRELITTPLMLSIFSLAYRESAVNTTILEEEQSPSITHITPLLIRLKKRSPGLETHQRQVFSTYVTNMLTRRGMLCTGTKEQIMAWLIWLAKQMASNNETVFYPEELYKWIFHPILSFFIIALILIVLPATVIFLFTNSVMFVVMYIYFSLPILNEIESSSGVNLLYFIALSYCWQYGYLPLQLDSFLNEATERLLLRKFGDGYIFTHRLLLDYFASSKIPIPPNITPSRNTKE